MRGDGGGVGEWRVMRVRVQYNTQVQSRRRTGSRGNVQYSTVQYSTVVCRVECVGSPHIIIATAHHTVHKYSTVKHITAQHSTTDSQRISPHHHQHHTIHQYNT